MFFQGRTECVRSATCATRSTVLAVVNNSGDMAALLKECSTTHSRLVKEAALGNSVQKSSFIFKPMRKKVLKKKNKKGNVGTLLMVRSSNPFLTIFGI